LVLPTNKIWIRFKVLSVPSEIFGFKLFCYQTIHLFPRLCADSNAKLIVTPHPYDNNMDQVYSIETTSNNQEKKVFVAFSNESSTELNCDYFQTFLNDLRTNDSLSPFDEEKFNGGLKATHKNFPTKTNPLFIPQNNFFIKFHSDNSKTSYGFQMIALPISVAM
jgi:hypothetical protein